MKNKNRIYRRKEVRYEKINKIDNPSARLTKKKRAQMKSNEKEVTTDTTEIQRMRDYTEQVRQWSNGYVLRNIWFFKGWIMKQ